METFPAGAMVAVLPDGTIAGSATSLIISFDGKPHTWAEVADNGYLRQSHDPEGDSLYGIDVCVRPAYRKLGVAKALYEARKQLVTQLGLKRYLAGCRIPGYHLYAAQLSPQEYADRVAKGEIYDQVLSFMLKQGLSPIQILPNYVEDEESLNYAVLVEWKNPAIKE
ncbi:MAG: GNAT family N-acetyltransferase [Clostridia bacterium]